MKSQVEEAQLVDAKSNKLIKIKHADGLDFISDLAVDSVTGNIYIALVR